MAARYTRSEPVADELKEMGRTVADNLGEGAKLRVELVEAIPFEPNGKFKDCRCLVTDESV